jgi:predicted transcriptional regulator YheO
MGDVALHDAEADALAMIENGSFSKRRVQRRIDEITAQKYKLQDENEQLRRECEEWRELALEYQRSNEKFKAALRKRLNGR